MADVVLGPAGSAVVVDLDVCAKTGRATRDRVDFRGSTRPAWVNVLLVVSVVGFLIASTMTARSFRVRVPFEHEAHTRWLRYKIAAWAVGLVGLGVLVVGVVDEAAPWSLTGVGIVAVALVGGTLNAVVHGLGFGTDRDGHLLLTRAHPAFVDAVAQATVEPVPRLTVPATQRDSRANLTARVGFAHDRTAGGSRPRASGGQLVGRRAPGTASGRQDHPGS